MELINTFESKINTLHIELSKEQYSQYVTYYNMVVEKNKVMNLTGITEFDEFIDKHYIDSLSIVNAVDMTRVNSIIDVGTGAGFPGIPLKIAFPNLKLTVLDSLNKRVKFLNEVIGILGLEKIEAVHGRAEDFGRNLEYRGQFDLCVSRAVANLATLSEYCMPFVKVGGAFIPYKSGKVEEELNQAKGAVKLLGGKIENAVSFELPKTEGERTLVVIRKVEATAKKYPRKAGLPSKVPLALVLKRRFRADFAAWNFLLSKTHFQHKIITLFSHNHLNFLTVCT